MKINQNLLKENTELKHHILILTDQNKNIISELENIKNEKYSVIVIVATNKKILENSLIKIELFYIKIKYKNCNYSKNIKIIQKISKIEIFLQFSH